MKPKSRPKPVARPRKAPIPAPRPTPKPAKSTAPGAPVARETHSKPVSPKAKALKRPAKPQGHFFQDGQLLVASWYDDGARHAAARVESSDYAWSEEQERWLEQVELFLYPALAARQRVTVTATHGGWRGPRETMYLLAEPNPQEKVSVEAAIERAAQARDTPAENGHARRPRAVGGVSDKTAQIIAMLKRPKGVPITEIMEATGWQKHSVRGFMSGMLKKKMGLTVVREDQTYFIKG